MWYLRCRVWFARTIWRTRVAKRSILRPPQSMCNTHKRYPQDRWQMTLTHLMQVKRHDNKKNSSFYLLYSVAFWRNLVESTGDSIDFSIHTQHVADTRIFIDSWRQEPPHPKQVLNIHVSWRIDLHNWRARLPRPILQFSAHKGIFRTGTIQHR